MVLGAHLGMDAIPDAWQKGMRKKAMIVELLERIGGRG
jgi:hypothetical protein